MVFISFSILDPLLTKSTGVYWERDWERGLGEGLGEGWERCLGEGL